MLLNELFEAGTKHVTFCFGRMNPPTIGHKQVFDTMQSQGGEMKIFVSQSQDKKKNPLDYGTKIKFIKEMFPQYAKDVVDNAALNTIGKVASYLHEQGYTAVTFVAGSDRMDSMKSLLDQYNGVEGKAHGFYKFDVIDFASSGDREDGAEGVAGVSASGARSAAANNDFKAFQEATGAGELAKPLFAAVRKGMGIKGEVEESSLNEFDPGEDGFGPFKVYVHDEFIEKFATFDQAKEEIEFLRTADPKSFDADWKIIDGTGKTVWQHDPGEAIDAMRMRRKLQFIKPDEGVEEASLGNVLPWPEVVNKVSSAMKATGWKSKRMSDDAFMFTTRGAEVEDQWYIAIIDNAGDGFFTYALGTVEEGDPHIDDAFKGKLPNTEASVSELMDEIRDGFGLD